MNISRHGCLLVCTSYFFYLCILEILEFCKGIQKNSENQSFLNVNLKLL